MSLETGIIQLYNFDSFAGVAIDDVGGVNISNVVTTNPGLTPGIIGSALNFNGSQSITTNTPMLIGNLDNFSVSIWLNFNAFVSTEWVLQGESGSGSYFYICRQGTGEVTFGLRDLNGGLFTPTTTSAAPILSWTHYLLTYERNLNIKIYINGVLNVTIPVSDFPTGFTAGGGTPIFSIGATVGDTLHFTGLIDQLIFYNRLLSLTELSTLFSNGAGFILNGNFSTLITTPGGVNSNSYISVNEADTFLSTNAEFSTWNSLTFTEKEKFLKEATVYMDCVYRWFGRIASDTQKLAFPRTGLINRQGVCILGSAIPEPVKRAEALYALQFSLSTSSLFLLESQGAAQIQRVEAGNIEVEAGSTQSDFDAVLGIKRFPWIEALLLSFGSILGQNDLDDRTICVQKFF